MVDELHPLPEPAFLLLVVELIQIAILQTAHEYPAVRGPDHGRHFNV